MNQQDFTRGSHWAFHSWNMFKTTAYNMINVAMMSILFSICILNYFDIEHHAWVTAFHYWKCLQFNSLGMSLDKEVQYFWEGVKYTSTLAEVIDSQALKHWSSKTCA